MLDFTPNWRSVNSIKFKVKFLGYVIFKNDIRMDPHKVQSIVD
jgi:hypothetical protein